MSSGITKTILYIDNMTCVNCENTIERALTGIAGIENVKASYSSGTVNISYRPDEIGLDKIKELIEAHDYHVSPERKTAKSCKMRAKEEDAGNDKRLAGEKAKELDLTDIIGIGIIIFALYVLLSRLGFTDVFNAFPLAREGMDYGMLFVIGLMTSVHCVAMCGGICLTQCAAKEADSKANSSKLATIRPSLLYNTGRVASYTVIGGIVGALGSLVSFSGAAKGIVQIAAGIFMIIMGLNMLGLFPSLRKFTPRMPKIFAKGIYRQREKSASPFIIGLLNGLMPCGPLQAMQLYALSTGDPLKGAFSMLLFSAGTFPLMFAFGALSSMLSRRFTAKMMKAAAVLVLILGVFMFRNGAALSGLMLPALPGSAGTTEAVNVARLEDGVQIVKSGITPGSYEPIVVQKGIPVKWIIQAQKGEINGCNNSIIVPAFGIRKDLAEGDTIIEFIPDKSGSFSFSCWMGMIRSRITVVDDLSNID